MSSFNQMYIRRKIVTKTMKNVWLKDQTAKSGFTLIELLVVISIISLLIAILLPALSTARDTGMMTQSLSNARQFNLALSNYCVDNKDNYPYYMMKFDVTGGGLRYWLGKRLLAQGYVGADSLYWGPSRDKSWFPYVSAPTQYVGYQPNYYVMPDWLESAGATNLKPMNPNCAYKTYFNATRIPKPGSISTLVEGWSQAAYNNNPPRDGGNNIYPDSSADLKCYTWKSGALVRTYMDGHGATSNSTDVGWQATDNRNGTWTSAASSGQSLPWQ